MGSFSIKIFFFYPLIWTWGHPLRHELHVIESPAVSTKLYHFGAEEVKISPASIAAILVWHYNRAQMFLEILFESYERDKKIIIALR
jgi:hypothetical protein